jgi:hypothetical protein
VWTDDDDDEEFVYHGSPVRNRGQPPGRHANLAQNHSAVSRQILHTSSTYYLPPQYISPHVAASDTSSDSGMNSAKSVGRQSAASTSSKNGPRLKRSTEFKSMQRLSTEGICGYGSLRGLPLSGGGVSSTYGTIPDSPYANDSLRRSSSTLSASSDSTIQAYHLHSERMYLLPHRKVDPLSPGFASGDQGAPSESSALTVSLARAQRVQSHQSSRRGGGGERRRRGRGDRRPAK